MDPSVKASSWGITWKLFGWLGKVEKNVVEIDGCFETLSEEVFLVESTLVVEKRLKAILEKVILRHLDKKF